MLRRVHPLRMEQLSKLGKVICAPWSLHISGMMGMANK